MYALIHVEVFMQEMIHCSQCWCVRTNPTDCGQLPFVNDVGKREKMIGM